MQLLLKSSLSQNVCAVSVQVSGPGDADVKSQRGLEIDITNILCWFTDVPSYISKKYLFPLESLKSSFCWLEEQDNSTEAETPHSEKSSSFAKRRLFCKDTFLLMPKMFRKLNPEMNFVFQSFSRKASQLSKFRSWSLGSRNQEPGPDLIKILSE